MAEEVEDGAFEADRARPHRAERQKAAGRAVQRGNGYVAARLVVQGDMDRVALAPEAEQRPVLGLEPRREGVPARLVEAEARPRPVSLDRRGKAGEETVEALALLAHRLIRAAWRHAGTTRPEPPAGRARRSARGRDGRRAAPARPR